MSKHIDYDLIDFKLGKPMDVISMAKKKNNVNRNPLGLMDCG